MDMLFPRYVWLTYSDETGTLKNTTCDGGGSSMDGALEGLFMLRSLTKNQSDDDDGGGDDLVDVSRRLPFLSARDISVVRHLP